MASPVSVFFFALSIVSLDSAANDPGKPIDTLQSYLLIHVRKAGLLSAAAARTPAPPHRLQIFTRSHVSRCTLKVHAISRCGSPGAQLDVHFGECETVHIENSCKFARKMIRLLLQDSGFAVERTWRDEKD